MHDIKWKRIKLTAEQVEELSDIQETIREMYDREKPGIFLGKVAIDEETGLGYIGAILWPNKPGVEIIEYMEKLMKWYDIEASEFKEK